MLDETQLITAHKDNDKKYIDVEYEQLAQRFNLDRIILRNDKICFNIAEFDKQYTILEKIGEGCIGVVKKVLHKQSGRYFAIKTVSTTSEEILRNIIIEFISLLNLSHENVVQVYQLFIDYNDSFMSESRAVLVMELVEGNEMFGVITEMGRYTESNARDLFRQILNALQYLHEKNICHRDLKPHNILCTKDHKKIKITDFNVSKFYEPQQQFAVTDIQKLEMWTYTGTLAFSAPEMFLGQGYDYRVDIWSAGCILYTMLSGLLPFNGDYVHCLIEQITMKEVPFPQQQFSKVSGQALELIKKLLEKNPCNRIDLKTAIKHPWFKIDLNNTLEGFSSKNVSQLVPTKLSLKNYQTVLSQVSSSSVSNNHNSSELSLNFPRKKTRCQAVRNRRYNYEGTKSVREVSFDEQKYLLKPLYSEDLKLVLQAKPYNPIVFIENNNVFLQNT